MELWGPLIDPGNENFDLVWTRLGDGFKATLIAAVLAIVCSLIVGTALADRSGCSSRRCAAPLRRHGAPARRCLLRGARAWR